MLNILFEERNEPAPMDASLQDAGAVEVASSRRLMLAFSNINLLQEEVTVPDVKILSLERVNSLFEHFSTQPAAHAVDQAACCDVALFSRVLAADLQQNPEVSRELAREEWTSVRWGGNRESRLDREKKRKQAGDRGS